MPIGQVETFDWVNKAEPALRCLARSHKGRKMTVLEWKGFFPATDDIDGSGQYWRVGRTECQQHSPKRPFLFVSITSRTDINRTHIVYNDVADLEGSSPSKPLMMRLGRSL